MTTEDKEERAKELDELDNLCARIIMGWQDANIIADGCPVWHHRAAGRAEYQWRPTRFAEDARRVQDKLIERGYELRKHRNPGPNGLWLFTMWRREPNSSAPLIWKVVNKSEFVGLCVLALKAHWIEVGWLDGVRQP